MTMMTYWQRLHGDTPSSIALLGLGREISALGFHWGKSSCSWWRLQASWMRMDEDIWLSAVRRPIWLCQKSTREREDTRGLVSKGICSLPPLHSSSSSSFTGWNLLYFCLYSCFIRQDALSSDRNESLSVIDCCFSAEGACYASLNSCVFNKSCYIFRGGRCK